MNSVLNWPRNDLAYPRLLIKMAKRFLAKQFLKTALIFSFNIYRVSNIMGKQLNSAIFNFFLFYLNSYEPELFPGLIYRMVKPRIVLLIFVSGKVVLTGKF